METSNLVYLQNVGSVELFQKKKQDLNFTLKSNPKNFDLAAFKKRFDKIDEKFDAYFSKQLAQVKEVPEISIQRYYLESSGGKLYGGISQGTLVEFLKKNNLYVEFLIPHINSYISYLSSWGGSDIALVKADDGRLVWLKFLIEDDEYVPGTGKIRDARAEIEIEDFEPEKLIPSDYILLLSSDILFNSSFT